MNKSQNVPMGTVNIFRKYGNILEISISGKSVESLLTGVKGYLAKNRVKKTKIASNRPLFITTPNPEQLVMAENDGEFKKIIQNSDISLCDGFGLLVAYEYLDRLKRNDLKNRKSTFFVFPTTLHKFSVFVQSYIYLLKKGKSRDGLRVVRGRDFVMELLEIANDKKYRVFLLGSSGKVLTKSLKILKVLYPSVHFKAYSGAKYDTNAVPLNKNQRQSDKRALRLVNNFKPDLTFVAFGAPKQEKWVYRNIGSMNTRLIMVVGSTFDYIAGTRKHVPQRLERAGMEWLWRILTGSQNIGRIYNAVIKFPWLVFMKS